MRVAIYVRISKDSSDTDNQLYVLREWAIGAGHTIVREYVDIEHGDRGADRRPELARLLRDAEAGLLDLVSVFALDRLTREGILAGLSYLQRLTACRVGLRSHTEEYLDTSNELVRDILTCLLLAVARQERRRISERTKAGLDRVRRNGSKSGKKIGRPGLAAEKVRMIRELAATYDKFQIASRLKVHPKTVAKYTA